MEGTCSSETSVDFRRATLRYITEDRTPHNHRCENLKSYHKCFRIFSQSLQANNVYRLLFSRIYVHSHTSSMQLDFFNWCNCVKYTTNCASSYYIVSAPSAFKPNISPEYNSGWCCRYVVGCREYSRVIPISSRHAVSSGIRPKLLFIFMRSVRYVRRMSAYRVVRVCPSAFLILSTGRILMKCDMEIMPPEVTQDACF
jgi:hypothetical protein